MGDKAAVKKRTLVVGVVFLLAIALLSIAVIARVDPETGDEQSLPLAWECPQKTGTCTAGDQVCEEDLGNPPIHACTYKCQAGGTWGAGTECGNNMCYAGECSSLTPDLTGEGFTEEAF